MPLIQGQVGSLTTTRLGDGTTTNAFQGRQGEICVSELHGKHYQSNMSGLVFHAHVTGVTVPVIAANLVSVFSLINPAGSTRSVELISADVGIVLATTVVNTLNLYQQSIRGGSLVPTVFTAGVAQPGLIGGAASSAALFCSAATHIGTPVAVCQIATFGAVTTTAANAIHLEFDGTVILAPGSIVSFAMSTAAGTANGLSLGLRWSEGPLNG